tara:strand:+ start:180 stop:1097 length:918 start_codon:yes stop_codon:yes gene_type:complete
MTSKIIFMGTPEFSIPALQSLNLKHKIKSVYTQPPKKKSRGQKIIKSPIHIEAEKLKIPVRFPKNFNNDSDYEFIKSTDVNFVIVVAYGQIIPEKFLNIKNLIFLNIHASLLPRWRGAAPIQRSIMEMDKETGISIMKIIPKLDAGPYILQKRTNINPKDNYLSLSKKLSKIGAELILESISLFEKNKIKFKDQQDKFVTYAKKISKEESEVNWNENAEKLIAKINGLNPYPGAWFNHNGKRIKILEAQLSDNQGKAGEVLTDDLVIGCKDKAIKINLIQKEGKVVLDTKRFLTGYKIVKGEMLV